jgi:outer membrane receptor for monomeric catechols
MLTGIGDYVGRRFANFSNDVSEGVFFLTSARIDARVPEGVLLVRKADLALNVTNLTQKTRVPTLSTGSATNSYSAYPIPPRQWFLTLSAAY